MDEGVKRKLAGAGVLVLVALIVLPQISSKTQNAEYLSQTVPIEVNIPVMDMPLPKSLAIPVDPIISMEQAAGEKVFIPVMTVDDEVLPASQFEIPVQTQTGESVVWQIQVGSFAQRENALKLRDRLRQSGYKAFDQLSDDGLYTRVFVGPSTQKSELEQKMSSIEQHFRLKAQLVPFQNQ